MCASWLLVTGVAEKYEELNFKGAQIKTNIFELYHMLNVDFSWFLIYYIQ